MQEKTRTKSSLAVKTSLAIEESVLDPELYGSGPHSKLFGQLVNIIAKLKAEKLALQEEILRAEFSSLPDGENDEKPPPQEPDLHPMYEILHVVECGKENQSFRDVPQKYKGDIKDDHLRGRDEVENTTKYLKDHTGTAFAILEFYSCNHYGAHSLLSSIGYKTGKLVRDAPPAQPEGQVLALNERLREALKTIITSNPTRFSGYSTIDFPWYLRPPYSLFYIHLKTFNELSASSGLDERDRARVTLLCEWLEKNSGADWKEADDLLSKGKINLKHYPKLFRPDELLLDKDEDGVMNAAKTELWPQVADDNRLTFFQWSFNGVFRKDTFAIPLRSHAKLNIPEKEIDITSLDIFPLRFADSEAYGKLSARGEKFWLCRKKRLICYKDTDQLHMKEVRFQSLA